jgi:hypothetical protein
MRILIHLGALATVSACTRPAPVVSWPDQFFVPSYPQLGYGIKRVIEKQAPITLVAHDGSVCRTSRLRFSRTRTGRWIDCAWNLPSLDSTVIAHNTRAEP